MWHRRYGRPKRVGTIANYIRARAKENRGNNQPTNLRVFRLAEVYLNYAEACYFSGDIANAQKYLNEVRSHANVWL